MIRGASPKFIAGRLIERSMSTDDAHLRDLLALACAMLETAESVLRLADDDIADWRSMNGHDAFDKDPERDVRAIIAECLSGDWFEGVRDG